MLEATIYAASVDSLDQAQGMVARGGITYPVAHGVTKGESELFGAWWSDDRGGYIQPAEFLLSRGGVVLGSMYASGPVGRMGADEVVRQIAWEVVPELAERLVRQRIRQIEEEAG